MKIAFVLDDSLDRSDGVQQYITTLGQWFDNQRHDVHYLVGKTTKSSLKNVHSLSGTVKVRFNKNRLSIPLPASKSKICELLEKEKFDVLHVQMPYSPMLAEKVILNAPAGTAVIGTFHILPFSKLEAVSTRVLGVWLRRSLKRFDRTFSVSAPAAGFAYATFGIETQVLPNAVDLDRFKAGKKLKRYSDGKLNVVYLGRLVSRKGCPHLLSAFSHLKRQGALKNVRLIVAGSGPLEGKLKNYVKANDLQDIVEFVGFISETAKPDYLASADLAVFPSTGGESFGIVLVEAMAAGANVVIAGDNPGYSFVLNSNQEQMVNPADTEAFARTLQHFLQNDRARKRAKTRQMDLVADYDVRTVGPKLLKTYREVLRSRQDVR